MPFFVLQHKIPAGMYHNIKEDSLWIWGWSHYLYWCLLWNPVANLHNLKMQH